MNTLKDLLSNKRLKNTLEGFLSFHGLSGFEEALKIYDDFQQTYICRAQTTVYKIKISDINYITIHGHHMEIHTSNATYQKYGSLNQELTILSSYGFTKCNQSCIVSLHKIQSISENNIFLTDGTCLHMSRKCSTRVISDISRKRFSQK
ncbi:MAG: LytTR family DNA-binding domain-containing protein [bacterium]|nr:LytTR family DNA-binding domain-containing protein [bacterium]